MPIGIIALAEGVGSVVRTRLVVALGIVLAACGGAPTSTAPEIPAEPVFVGEFETLAGETFELGSLEGRDVVLWFWAPW